MAKKHPPVRTKSVVCISCRDRGLHPRPVEMKAVKTTKAKGLENHLIASFICPRCEMVIGIIYENVKIMKDGKVIPIPIVKFDKRK